MFLMKTTLTKQWVISQQTTLPRFRLMANLTCSYINNPHIMFDNKGLGVIVPSWATTRKNDLIHTCPSFSRTFRTTKEMNLPQAWPHMSAPSHHFNTIDLYLTVAHTQRRTTQRQLQWSLVYKCDLKSRQIQLIIHW